MAIRGLRWKRADPPAMLSRTVPSSGNTSTPATSSTAGRGGSCAAAVSAGGDASSANVDSITKRLITPPDRECAACRRTGSCVGEMVLDRVEEYRTQVVGLARADAFYRQECLY